MLLSVIGKGGNALERLLCEAENANEPTVVLDAELKVAGKSRTASKYTCGIRVGARIDRFLPEGDAIRLGEMLEGEVFTTSVVTAKTKCRVNAVRYADCYVLVFRPLSGGIREEMLSRYGRMSGYDLRLDMDTDNENAPAQAQSRLSCIVEALIDESEAMRRLPFFDAASVLNRIKDEASRRRGVYGKRLNESFSLKHALAEGAERDFALVSAFAIGFCLDFGEGEVDITLENEENELEIIISCALGEDVGRATHAVSYLDITKRGFDETKLAAYSARLLAEANLWELYTEVCGGRISFTLRMPYIKSGEEFFVREISAEFLREIVALLVQGENT